MGFTRDSAIQRAKQDLADRLGQDPGSIKEQSVKDRDFPDMSLGAATDGEMSAQMISTGWEIKLEAQKKTYEYRADKFHLRLVDFKGRNHVID